jgi:hypothetical protein
MSISVKNLLIKQAFAISLNKSLEDDVIAVEEECSVLFDNTLQKFGLKQFVTYSTQIRPGFMNKNWSPHFLIIRIETNQNRFFGYQKEHVFVKISNNWFAAIRSVAHLGAIPIESIDFTKKLDHIDLNKLKEACDELTEKSGFPVKFTEHTIQNMPKTKLDLLEEHKGSTIVCSGVENKEPWAILRTRKHHFIVYYSTNGYDLGYDKCLKPEQSKNEFFTWLGDEDTVKSLIPEKILAKLKL